LTSRLIELRKDGIDNDEIAATLGVTKSALEAQIQALIARGAIPSRTGLLCSHPDSYVQGRERTAASIARDLERLYDEGRSHEEMATALELTKHQVHNQLHALFAAGLPKQPRTLTDEQVRAIHNAYLAGGSIDKLAQEIGFTGSAVRIRMKKLDLKKLDLSVGGGIGQRA
jgi:predicted ArsR family transcriptional regulator